MKTAPWIALGLLPTLVACGDVTSSTGELGRLRYALHSDYEVDAFELTEAGIVTGHEQRIDLRLTDKGRNDIEEPQRLVHSMTPTGGVTVETLDRGEDLPPDVRVRVRDPGTYKLESKIEDEVLDWLELTFEEPADFELLVSARDPWDEDFTERGGDPIAVEEGTQIVIQPVPRGSGGERLAGDIEAEATVDPQWAVVPGKGVLKAYEEGVWVVGNEINFYFIEPEEVTFTITDPVSGASTDQAFSVSPVPQN